MLLLPDLISFSNAFVSLRTNIENNITVASEDEAVAQYKEVINAGNNCTMLTLIPTHDANAEDEDNAEMRNNLTFYILKKTDSKSGYQQKLDNFALTQIEILELSKYIKSLVQNFGVNCLFKDIDLSTIQITPINNYLGANGYVIDFTTETKF